MVGVALGNGTAGSVSFTYYPGMPGNSTALPAEKLQLQSTSVTGKHWQGASVWTCPVKTLTGVSQRLGITHIDLLKVCHGC